MRCRRFDDAIESHKKAVTALEDALAAAANNSKAMESVRLQRDFHLKRLDLIRLKKKQYESYKTAIEYQRLRTIEPQISKARLESTCDLQIAIYKTLEESDSVLEAINGRKSDEQTNASGDDDMNKSTSGAEGDVQKTDGESNSSLVSDLQTLNHQLHILVFNLMSKMDESHNEMESLRDRVKMLEKERGGPLRSPVFAKIATNKMEHKSDETSAERQSRRCSITGEERKIVLPETSDFPPLELPEFDYSSFGKENEAQ